MSRMDRLSELDIASCQKLISQKVRRFFRLRLPEQEVEDICSQAMLDVLSKLPSHDESRASIRTYVSRIVDSSLFDQIRKRESLRRGGGVHVCSLSDSELAEFLDSSRGHSPDSSSEGSSELSIRRIQEKLDLRLDVEEALKGLRKADRRLLKLILGGLSIVAIAKKLRVSRGTIYRRLKAIGSRLPELNDQLEE